MHLFQLPWEFKYLPPLYKVDLLDVYFKILKKQRVRETIEQIRRGSKFFAGGMGNQKNLHREETSEAKNRKSENLDFFFFWVLNCELYVGRQMVTIRPTLETLKKKLKIKNKMKFTDGHELKEALILFLLFISSFFHMSVVNIYGYIHICICIFLR